MVFYYVSCTKEMIDGVQRDMAMWGPFEKADQAKWFIDRFPELIKKTGATRVDITMVPKKLGLQWKANKRAWRDRLLGD